MISLFTRRTKASWNHVSGVSNAMPERLRIDARICSIDSDPQSWYLATDGAERYSNTESASCGNNRRRMSRSVSMDSNTNSLLLADDVDCITREERLLQRGR